MKFKLKIISIGRYINKENTIYLYQGFSNYRPRPTGGPCGYYGGTMKYLYIFILFYLLPSFLASLTIIIPFVLTYLCKTVLLHFQITK